MPLITTSACRPAVPRAGNQLKSRDATDRHTDSPVLHRRGHCPRGAQRRLRQLRPGLCPRAATQGRGAADRAGDRLVARWSHCVARRKRETSAPSPSGAQGYGQDGANGRHMTGLYVLALLVPLAFASGWWSARRSGARRSGAQVSELSSDYFRGLNYLLNEEQDKAIEVFLRLAEYNRDTVETHLALGNLFRRRGEVDRAIRLHQHLVSRQGLSDEMKTVALLELGEDYMRAGLLDRAETLFSDLVAMDALAPSALRHLISIYQHEREWHKAIDHARRLEAMNSEDEAPMIAQFYCELAEQARQHGARTEARDYVREAFLCQQDCVRAHMIAGRLSFEEDDMPAAIDSCERRTPANIPFVPETLPPLLNCYARSQQMDRAEAFLREIMERYHGISPVLALTRLYEGRDGERMAIDFLTG